MLQAYKLKEDNQFLKTPRIFIEDIDTHYMWIAATPTLKTVYGIDSYWCKKNYKLEPTNIDKEKWVHPHLLKKLKQDLEISK